MKFSESSSAADASSVKSTSFNDTSDSTSTFFESLSLLKLGKLARISISDDKLNNLSKDLNSILEFVDQLKEIKTDQEKFDLAASFQRTIEEILYKKTKIAFKDFEKQSNPTKKNFVIAGGVAANENIRNMLISLCEEQNYQTIFPPKELCGDNAAMIAMVGLEKFKLKQFSELDHPAKPRWPLDEDAAFLKGAGVQL